MELKRIRIPLLCLISLLVLLALFGCQKSETTTTAAGPPAELKDLAAKEKQWLTELEPMAEKTQNLYNQWINGEISQEELTEQYKVIYVELRVLKGKYDAYIEQNPLPEKIKDNSYYQEGLYYGKKLRSDLNNFLFTATEGYINKETKTLTKVNDFQLEMLYKDRIEKDYTEHLQKLQNSLKEYETK